GEGGRRGLHRQGAGAADCRYTRRSGAGGGAQGLRGDLMLRILFFLILVFAVGLGFAWLADRPGDLVVTFNDYQYQVTLMVAAVILFAVVVLTMVTWWLLKGILYSPYTVSRYFRV